MHAEPALAETDELDLPQDLVLELKRHGPARRDDLHVEGWKPSLLGRVAELFAGKTRR